MLGFDRFYAAALANNFFLIFDFSEEFDDVPGILLKVFRVAVDGGLQGCSRHSASSQRNHGWLSVYKKEQERIATETRKNKEVSRNRGDEIARNKNRGGLGVGVLFLDEVDDGLGGGAGEEDFGYTGLFEGG